MFVHLTTGPTHAWSHLSWTYLENEEVTNELTAFDGCKSETVAKFTVRGRLNGEDECAREDIVKIRVCFAYL